MIFACFVLLAVLALSTVVILSLAYFRKDSKQLPPQASAPQTTLPAADSPLPVEKPGIEFIREALNNRAPEKFDHFFRPQPGSSPEEQIAALARIEENEGKISRIEPTPC